MEYGVHLPLIDFSGKGFSLTELRAYAKQASELGYTFLCANDHLTAYAAAGAQRVFLWPLDDELEQLELFYHQVVPLISDDGS